MRQTRDNTEYNYIITYKTTSWAGRMVVLSKYTDFGKIIDSFRATEEKLATGKNLPRFRYD